MALVQCSGLCVDTLVNVSLSPAHKLLKASLEPFSLVLASVLTFVATRVAPLLYKYWFQVFQM